jgi:hypothetical protein
MSACFQRCLSLAAVGILLGVTAAPAHGYQTAPASGGDARYRSVVIAIDAAAPGLSASIVGHDNLVRLDNRSASTVVVFGYSGDQYARLLPDGTVQLNLRSPAFYLNEYRFGDQRVPPYADARTAPQWRTMDHSGELLWHDHRIHVAKGVKTPSSTPRNTLLRSYRIPLRVGARPAAIDGRLYWVGGGSTSSWELFALPPVSLVFALLVFDSLRRGRRARAFGGA